MVSLFDKDGNVLRTFLTARAFDQSSVTFDNNGYPGKIYANVEAGEYIDDPDNPIPLSPSGDVTDDMMSALRTLGVSVDG